MSNPDTKIKSFQLSEGKTSVFQIGLILLVALFFIGLVWLGGWVDWEIKDIGYNNLVVSESEITTPITISPPETVSDPAIEGEVPEGFPAGIPLNKKISIVESYNSKSVATGEITEARVVFQSSQTIKENQTFYEKWAKDNKWQVITNNVDTDDINKDIIHLALSKDNNYLNISLEELLYNTTKVMIVYRPAVDSGLNEMTDEMKEQLRNIRF